MRGFALTGYMVAMGAIAGAALLGVVALQSWRLSQAQEALGAERAGKALAMARIEALSAEKRAAEGALAERDTAHEAIRRMAAQTRRQIQEVTQHDPEARDWMDRPVPGGIARLLADRRGGGQPVTDATDDAAATVPGTAGGGGDAPRPGSAGAGTR